MRLLFPTQPLPIPATDAAAHATSTPWPVWAGSVASPVRFAPLAKKAAVRLWHRARDFDRGTHQPGHHGGAVGPTALQVLHALIFDFLNHRTGRLDPSYAAIARKAGGACARWPRRWLGCASSGSSTGCAAAPRVGGTGGSCSSRRPTPTPCCRKANGAATGRQQSRRRPRRARVG